MIGLNIWKRQIKEWKRKLNNLQMNIQPGSQVTFDLNGISTAGHVTFTEGNKATVMYAIAGKSDFIVLDFELLKVTNE